MKGGRKMGRGIHVVLRFVVGVVSIALVLKFLGISWNDVDYFIKHGLKSAFEIFGMFHNIAR